MSDYYVEDMDNEDDGDDEKDIEDIEDIEEKCDMSKSCKDLGSGEYGNVYAIDEFKAVKRQLISKSEGLSHQLGENDILQNVDHENIVKCYQVYADKINGNNDQMGIFTVMERCNGTLGEWAQENLLPRFESMEEPIPLPKEILDSVILYIYQIFSALAFLHKHHIIHGDLKSQNILLSSNGMIKLADFGLSQHIFDKQPRRETIQTAWFRAPEVILMDPYYDERVDVWSIGVLILKIVFNYMISLRDEEERAIEILFDFVKVLGIPSSESWRAFIKNIITENPIAEDEKLLIKQQHPLEPLLTVSTPIDKDVDLSILHTWLKTSLKEQYNRSVILFGQDNIDCFVDLIQKCLSIDPSTRIHAFDALGHPLFKNIPGDKKVIHGIYREVAAASPEEEKMVSDVLIKLKNQMKKYMEKYCLEFGWHPNTFTISLDMLNRLFSYPRIKCALVNDQLSPKIFCATILTLAVNYNQGHVPLGDTILEVNILHTILDAMHLPSGNCIHIIKSLQIQFCNILEFKMLSEKCRRSLHPFINYF